MGGTAMGQRCRVTVAVNYLCLNKTMKGEHENWNNIQTTIGELHSGVVVRAAFNALFRGGYRNARTWWRHHRY